MNIYTNRSSLREKNERIARILGGHVYDSPKLRGKVEWVPWPNWSISDPDLLPLVRRIPANHFASNIRESSSRLRDFIQAISLSDRTSDSLIEFRRTSRSKDLIGIKNARQYNENFANKPDLIYDSIINEEDSADILINAFSAGLDVGMSVEDEVLSETESTRGVIVLETLRAMVVSAVFRKIEEKIKQTVPHKTRSKIVDAMEPWLENKCTSISNFFRKNGVAVVPREREGELNGYDNWIEYFWAYPPPLYQGYSKDGKAVEFFLRNYRGINPIKGDQKPGVDFVSWGFSQADLRYYDKKLLYALQSVEFATAQGFSFPEHLPSYSKEGRLRASKDKNH